MIRSKYAPIIREYMLAQPTLSATIKQVCMDLELYSSRVNYVLHRMDDVYVCDWRGKVPIFKIVPIPADVPKPKSKWPKKKPKQPQPA